MKGVFLVEPVVALYAFAGVLIYPLIQQYVYRTLWRELTHTEYPAHDSTSRCANVSSNVTSYHEEVQKQASLFSLYTELFSTIPSLVVTLFLVAYSDRRGRKIAIVMPMVGALIYSLSFLAVSYFQLNVYLLIGVSLITSMFGGLGTFMGGCFAYIADLCENSRQKTLRMAGLDMMIGLLSGVASISSGYFLRAAGFNWPVVTAAVCQCVTLLYAVFFLEETVKRASYASALTDSADHSALKGVVLGIYQMFAGLSRRSKVLLALLLLVFSTFSFAKFGGASVVTLYELNAPLCWDEILIGYGVALSTAVFVASFLGVAALTRCGVPQTLIVLLGCVSVIVGMVLVSFAKTTTLMFLATVPLLFSIMPFPVLRSMVSKIVLDSEQGALFACVAVLESLSSNIAVAVFSSVYASTVAWYPGFTFLLAAGFCLIPIVLLGVVFSLGVEESQEVKETDCFVPAEVEPNVDVNAVSC